MRSKDNNSKASLKGKNSQKKRKLKQKKKSRLMMQKLCCLCLKINKVKQEVCLKMLKKFRNNSKLQNNKIVKKKIQSKK